MTDQERAQLKEQLRQEIEAEMAEKQKTEAELREEIKKEVEVELRERVKREAELKERVDKLTNGDGAALSAKAEDVMAWLVELTEPQQEAALKLLESKVVDFGERGSGREGEHNVSATTAFLKEVERIQAEKRLSYGEAMAEVERNKPKLVEAYLAETRG